MKSTEAQLISEFLPSAEGFLQNPSAYHAGLLATSPGFITPEGVPSAYVATYEQCQNVLSNWQQFSSVKPANLPGMERTDFFNGQPVMNYSDPPEHSRRRQSVNVAFSPRRVQAMGNATAKTIENILQGIEKGQHICAVADVGMPLSIQLLLGEFLGVAPKDWPIFLEFAATLPLIDTLGPGDPKPKAYLEAWAKGEAYCRDALAKAQSGNADNVIGMVATANQGGVLSDAEMMAMMVVLFTGGLSTVASVVSSSLYYLASKPELAERIRNDETLAKSFVEEALRLEAPVTLVMRFATEDVPLGDSIIPNGMPVYTMISVANRDPAIFKNPTEFKLDRGNLRHLAFGHGIHNCIGNMITRSALPLLVVAMAKQFPTLQLSPKLDGTWHGILRARHRKTLPLVA